jgi:predicted AAA+ superfamily ATPase
MRHVQLVMGPAGCGKSTYCEQMHEHGLCTRRNIRIVNLDPAAENFNYPVSIDVRYAAKFFPVCGMIITLLSNNIHQGIDIFG